jgi:hypothetical protein
MHSPVAQTCGAGVPLQSAEEKSSSEKTLEPDASGRRRNAAEVWTIS